MTQQSPDTLIDPNRAPTLAGVERAAAKVAALLPQTPLLPLEIDGRTIWCTAECLQPVGAFKIRGAWHRLTDLSPETASSEERRGGKARDRTCTSGWQPLPKQK